MLRRPLALRCGGLPRTGPASRTIRRPHDPEGPREPPCPAAAIRSTTPTTTPPRRRTLPLRPRPLRLALRLPDHHPLRRALRLRRPGHRRTRPPHPPRTQRGELAGTRSSHRRRHLGTHRPHRHLRHRGECPRPRLHRHLACLPRRHRTPAAPHPRFPRDPRPPGPLHRPRPGPLTLDQSWALLKTETHATDTGPLNVDEYQVTDLDTGERQAVHLAGDVVLAAPGIELEHLESPPSTFA